MFKENDPIENIVKASKRLIHAHVCTPASRSIPMRGDGYDLRPFLCAVTDTGCTRMSIEAAFREEDFAQQIREAIVLLREAETAL